MVKFIRLCKNCNEPEEINFNDSILKLDFCSINCNEEYFYKYGRGLVPTLYKNNYLSIVNKRLSTKLINS